MKIIHIHPNGKYSHKFVNPLREEEIQNGFSSLLVNSVEAREEDYNINYDISKNNIFKLPFNILILFKLIYEIKPDTVFCHNSTSAMFPLLISRLLRVKNIIYFNHGIPFIAYNGSLRFILYTLEKINCLLCNKVITVSRAMKKILSEITPKEISLISNGSACGVDINGFVKLNEDTRFLRTKNNFRANDKIILFVGRANKRKGFYDIIQIWNKYFHMNPNVKLILLGIKKSDLLKFYDQIPNNVFPLSYVENPEKYFIISDYLFVTSYHEGLNYSVLEAMLFKTIVISNNIVGVSEIIRNKINGFLINNNNHEGFFKNFIQCENDLSFKKIVLKNAFQEVQKYDRQTFLLEYVKYLRKL